MGDTKNRAKKQSIENGQEFLRDSFLQEQNLLESKLEFSSKCITHSGIMGEVSEKYIIEFLEKYMPKRYIVDSGIIIDSTGKTSDQIDIVIFDNQYTPTLLSQQGHRYIPAEAVYAVIEVKQKITNENIKYAGEKAASVRCLERTSVEITHVEGKSKPKELHHIIAGLIALRSDWDEGLNAKTFKKYVNSLEGDKILDFVLAVDDRESGFFDKAASEPVCKTSCSLALFLFRLLDKLQALGTAPAADWKKYAEALSK